MKRKEDINKECGKRLKDLLNEREIKQYAFAEMVYCSSAYISNIIKGKKPLTIENAINFSKVLKVRYEYLLCEDDFKTESDMKHFLVHGIVNEHELIQKIAEIHGYKQIGDSIDGDYKTVKLYKGLSSEDMIKEIECYGYDSQIILEDYSGHRVRIDFDKYLEAIDDIGNYIDFRMASLMECYGGTVYNRLSQQTKTK